VTLNEADRTRLIRLLGMLGSDFDGERANAGAMANRLVRERGLTWDKVIPFQVNGAQQQQHTHQPPPPPPPLRSWSDVISDCRAHPNYITQWEEEFLDSMANWYGRPTDRQRAVLCRIAKKLKIELPPGEDYE